jgi:hypothetical protein
MNPSYSGKNWYSTLMDNFRSLMKKHDMPEDIAIDIENFVVEVAKSQFKAGNNSGISWMHKQNALKKNSEFQGAAA